MGRVERVAMLAMPEREKQAPDHREPCVPAKAFGFSLERDKKTL